LLGGSINQMLDNINALIRKVEEEQEEKRTIELYALFSQIRPHFLLNTLNSIKCNLAVEGDQVHSETIDSLMALLRAHLRVHEPIALAEECRLLGQYVSIMRMRNRLNVELNIELPERRQSILVPRLLLQPLVENSIIHGFSRSTRSPRIDVTVEESAGLVRIRIADNGRGIGAEQAAELNRILSGEGQQTGERGVGLYNVMRRTKLTFGATAEFVVGPGEPEGFVACLIIPWHHEEGGGRSDDQSDVDR
jgi:sensor histidine kinase YesM